MPTVFWSWQSDISARETREVFRTALAEAIQRLAVDLEEAERPELDHDTRNVPGSPEIVATILQKIDEAAVFVADVTPIAVSDGGKHLPNPNVLIELGYAKKSLSTERVILVWNTALYGSRPEDLPFDMRHRRAPFDIEVPLGADRALLREQRRHLTDRLEGALRASLAVVPDPPRPAIAWKESDPQSQGVWIDNAAGLPVNSGDSLPNISVDGSRFGYARLVPSTWAARPDAVGVLSNAQVAPPLLGRYSSSNWGPTRGGFMIFRQSGQTEENGLTSTATRWYRDSGEIWGVDGNFLRGSTDEVLYAEPFAIMRWIAWVRRSIECCRITGGSGTVSVALGIDNLDNARWARNFDPSSAPRALENSIENVFEIPINHTPNILYENILVTANAARAAFGLPDLTQEQFMQILAS